MISSFIMVKSATGREGLIIMGSDNEYPIKEKRVNESGDITPLVPYDFSSEDEETSEQPSKKQCQRGLRKSGSDGSSCLHDPQLVGSDVSEASKDVDEQYLMRSESGNRVLKEVGEYYFDGVEKCSYESSEDSDPTGLFSTHWDDDFSDGDDWADRGYNILKNEKVLISLFFINCILKNMSCYIICGNVADDKAQQALISVFCPIGFILRWGLGTNIAGAPRDVNEQQLMRSQRELFPLEEELSYALDGVEKVAYQESRDFDPLGWFSTHWCDLFSDGEGDWADRGYEILKSERVYYIWVKADRCSDTQCIELLKEAGCNESSFLRRSGKIPFVFYAKMDKEKAAKLKDVAGIAHFYSESEHYKAYC